MKGLVLLAKIGVPAEGARFGLSSIDRPALRKTHWRWFEINQSKRNWIFCRCHHSSSHRHNANLVQPALKTCDHIKALYEGRVVFDAGAAVARTTPWHAVYRVIFTPRGEALFSWRIAALALLKE